MVAVVSLIWHRMQPNNGAYRDGYWMVLEAKSTRFESGA
jgi:hypothetical protein